MSDEVLHRLEAGHLSGTRELRLAAGLTELPEALLGLADTLEVLDLSDNRLTALPEWFARFTRLQILFASNNPFTVLPDVLGRLPALSMLGFKANRIEHVPAAALAPTLRWLILTDNRIAELPDTLGHCRPMEKLMLAGNRLQRLPDTLAACENLALLRVAANRFEALPDWLLGMPRLSWLAYAGNPLNAQAEDAALDRARSTAIRWQDIELHGLLGEGTSGRIHAARWRGENVACKRFKSRMTSDGLPHSELAASLAAGTHPNLVGALALVEDDDGRDAGLLMPRVPEGSRTLAGPPSRTSCSRDVYTPNACFTPTEALRIAHGVAAAVAHLHAHGLLHGDVYAHNTCWHPDGSVLLGDFGAASLLPEDARIASALKRQEVRALGCLIEELGERTDAAIGEPLLELAAECMRPELQHRPSAAAVRDRLQALQHAVA